MGLCVPQECCAKGCGVLRRERSEGLELDVAAVLASRGAPCALPPASPGALLWACSPPHRRAAAAALLADVTPAGRRKAGVESGGGGSAAARAAALSEQGAALRDLLRLSASRGMPQGELLLRLIARIAPELGGAAAAAEEEEEEEDERAEAAPQFARRRLRA
jgi:hypothetical protein